VHVALACVGLVAVGAAAAASTATAACLKETCLYNVRIDVSLKNGTGSGIPSRPEGTISARLKATFHRVPIQELRFPGSKRYGLTVKRGLKSYEADTTAPGTLLATVNATRPCRISRSYSIPASLTAGGSIATGGFFSVTFGPGKAPKPSGCAGTAFGLQKIVVGGGSVQSGNVTTSVGLGDDLGVLAGSYDGLFERRPEPAVVQKLRAGRSFTVAHTFTREFEPPTPTETLSLRMTFERVG
jgi:hypothetical protein